MTNKIDYYAQLPQAFELLQSVHSVVADTGLNKKLIHLLLLRASQINRCAFCVKMHTQEARQDGETNQRLDRLVVWQQVEDFNLAEKAAFAWVEVLTNLHEKNDYQLHQNTLREYFSDQQVAGITLLIGMINLWNRIGVSNH